MRRPWASWPGPIKILPTGPPTPAETTKQWGLAYEIYASAYERTRGYWSGINAATIARYLNDKEQALVLANRVTEQCLQELARGTGDPGELYWLQATLGEAALIRGELSDAIKWYTQAGRGAGGRYGDLASTRRNARLLFTVMDLDPDQQQRIEACFQIPRVVVFAGHMIDQPGRLTASFPRLSGPQGISSRSPTPWSDWMPGSGQLQPPAAPTFYSSKPC